MFFKLNKLKYGINLSVLFKPSLALTLNGINLSASFKPSVALTLNEVKQNKYVIYPKSSLDFIRNKLKCVI